MCIDFVFTMAASFSKEEIEATYSTVSLEYFSLLELESDVFAILPTGYRKSLCYPVHLV